MHTLDRVSVSQPGQESVQFLVFRSTLGRRGDRIFQQLDQGSLILDNYVKWAAVGPKERISCGLVCLSSLASVSR